MTDTHKSIPFTIKSRYDDSTIYTAKEATTLRDAVIEAVGSGAYLINADLSGANLSGAYLRGAYLSDKPIIGTASIQFTGHGQCGRTLTAAKTEDNIYLWCGCFHGSPDELRAFISGDDKQYAKTRTLALDTILVLLDSKN